MSQDRLSPPASPQCLVRPYSSSQKGGTLIAEEVTDRATHDQRLRSPDGYRPRWCPHCGHRVLHVHDYPERKLFAEPADPEHPAAAVRVIRHECAACGATWRTLPAFLARHLWRSWPVVEAVTVGAPPPADQPEIPERTQRRWTARLQSAAALLVQLLATSAQAMLEKIAWAVGLLATREELVIAYGANTGCGRGWRLATLAALAHRLLPGVRLM